MSASFDILRAYTKVYTDTGRSPPVVRLSREKWNELYMEFRDTLRAQKARGEKETFLGMEIVVDYYGADFLGPISFHQSRTNAILACAAFASIKEKPTDKFSWR